MQKKMVGIIASVATAHAVLAIALITGGGCHQPKLLGPHTYNNGPEFAEIPAAANTPAEAAQTPAVMPQVPGSNEAVVLPPPPAKPVYPAQEPEAAPVATPVQSGTVTYTVKRGDTLSLIAYKHGVRTRDLAACNNLSGKAMNRIRIGQVLNIPEGGVYDAKRQPKKRAVAPKVKTAKKKSAKKVAELPADGVYVVKAGDSLDRIGRRYGVTAAAIAKENDIALTKVLQIGDKLRIPGKAAAAPAKSSTAATSAADNSSLDSTLNDLDPNIGLNTATPATETAAPAAPAATATETAPAAAPAAAATETANTAATDSSRTESIEVPEDTTIEAYSTKVMVSVEELRRLNPAIPADGKIKGGTYLVIPML